jgi:hypothetical protein
MKMSRITRIFQSITLALAGASCMACAPDDPGSPDATDLVFASDFCNYQSWTHYEFDGIPDAAAPDTLTGDGGCSLTHNFQVERDLYLNHAPSHGSTEFPPGTIIIKEQHDDTNPGNWHVYGMAKDREGDYNASSGCAGWEWFELSDDAGAMCPSIQWRGPGPMGSQYAGCANTTCTSCHAAAGNDCVQSNALRLSSY